MLFRSPISTQDGSKVLVVRSSHSRSNTLEEIKGAQAVGLENGDAVTDLIDIPTLKIQRLLGHLQYVEISRAPGPFYLVDAPQLREVEWEEVKVILKRVTWILGVLGVLAGVGTVATKPVSRRFFVGGAIAAAGATVTKLVFNSGGHMDLWMGKHALSDRDLTPGQLKAAKDILRTYEQDPENAYTQLLIVDRKSVV